MTEPAPPTTRDDAPPDELAPWRKLEGVDLATSATVTQHTWASFDSVAKTLHAAADGAPPEDDEAAAFDADLEVEGLIGEGGMALVHAAAQRSLGRHVAVKTARPGAKPEALRSLVEEARYTGLLEHPNIPPVHALYRSEDGPMMVMKLIQGVRWSELLADPEHPAWAGTKLFEDAPLVRHVELLTSVCDALHYAHSHGIVHRDLKPDNVMVGSFGEVYLLDWGIAARVDELAAQPPPRALVGTPAYMAPEMLSGCADARTDVYLAGAVLHEILTGSRRHVGEDLYSTLVSVREQVPYDYPADLPEELVRIAVVATAKDADDRFQSAVELRHALREWLRHRGAEQLVAASWARLEQARADATNRRRLLGECHFGFAQALAAWPDSAAARDGLRACRLAELEVRLDEGDLVGIEIVLEEIGDDLDASQRARLDALRARHADARRLLAEAQEMDRSISQRERTIFFVGMVMVTVPMWLFTLTLDRTGESGVVTLRAVSYPAVALACVGVAAAAFWRRLTRNRLGRQWLVSVLSITFAWLVSRLVALHHGVHIAVAISFDLVIIGLGIAALGIWTARWMLPSLVGFAASLALVTVRPKLYLPALLLSFVTLVGWLALGWKLGWGRDDARRDR